MQFYRVDILDLGTRRLSWRRLWSLIEQLPRESRFARVTIGEKARWGDTEHLLATVIDVLQISNWLYTSAHSKNRVPQPQRLPRPGVVEVDNERRIGGGKRYTTTEMRGLLATFEQRAADAETTSLEVG